MVSISRPFEGGQLHIRNFNQDFLLLTVSAELDILQLGRRLYQAGFPFVREVIVAETEICLQLEASYSPEDLDQLIDLPEVVLATPKTFELPVFFTEGGDWHDVCTHTGLTRQSIIQQLTDTSFAVAMFGFLPGFLYLDGLPNGLQVARKATPAKYVSAGAVAIGGKYLGVYAVDSPGGWQVIGHTPCTLLQRDQLPPTPFELGDRIRLIAISRAEYEYLAAHPKPLQHG